MTAVLATFQASRFLFGILIEFSIAHGGQQAVACGWAAGVESWRYHQEHCAVVEPLGSLPFFDSPIGKTMTMVRTQGCVALLDLGSRDPDAFCF